MKLYRRDLWPLAGLAAAGAGTHLLNREKPVVRHGKSPVALLKAANYEVDLRDVIRRGLVLCGLEVRGKTVLLKPNLVEFDADTCINTDARVVQAAIEVFEEMGAAKVQIGEGPGHRRDTLDLAEQAGYFGAIAKFEDRFVDLNRDDVVRVKNFAGSADMYLSASSLGADLVVSMAKMKTHHWAGATLSMKNFFGVVPGAVYGWPKNQLHQLGIDESIQALNRVYGRKSFAIVDGIVGMEGNGPIQGSPRHMGVLAFGSDLMAVDASCCRAMGIDPDQVGHLSDRSLGNRETEFIEQRGENIASVKQDFALLAQHRHMRKVDGVSR